MINVDQVLSDRISQGDIYRDIDYIQKIEVDKNGEVSIHKINFPLVIVLTQDCDLKQNSIYDRSTDKLPTSDDKKLLSIIVAPLYNEDLFLLGQHLLDIEWKMQVINKTSKGKNTTQYNSLIQNELSRYHHLAFNPDISIVDSVIDFKHYFTIDAENLFLNRKEKFICKVDILFRERITQRFSNFLSRIGLPNPNES